MVVGTVGTELGRSIIRYVCDTELKARLGYRRVIHGFQELEDELGLGYTVGQLSAVVQDAEECGMPRQKGQYEDAGLAVGRVSTEAECPFRVDVGQHEREVADGLDGDLTRVGELRRRLQHLDTRVRVRILLQDERLLVGRGRHRYLQIALEHPMDITVCLESRTHFAI